MSIEEHLLRMLINPKIQDTSKVGIGKLYCDALLIKESEQTINDKRSGPSIGLPPMKERPPAPQPLDAMPEVERRDRVH